MWFRVFGVNDAPVEPAALLEHLHTVGHPVRGHFKGDDEGWFQAEIILAEAQVFHLERFLHTEDGIRAELNTWAAWLETAGGPHSVALMQHMIRTAQLFTLHGDDDEDEEPGDWCVELCQYLCRATEGVYQVDNQGFFAADGALLVAE